MAGSARATGTDGSERPGGQRRSSGGTVTRKQAVTLGVRIAVSAAMLDRSRRPGALVRRRRARPRVAAGTAGWLGGAAVAHAGRHRAVGAALAGGARGARRSATRLRRLMSHYLAGQFVSNVLPTTIGGDVLRVSAACRVRPASRPATFASVVLERLTGWLVLPLHDLRRLRSSTPGSATSARPRRWRSPGVPPRCVLLVVVLAAVGQPPLRRTLRRPRRAGGASPAPCTSASTSCAATPAPPPTCSSSGSPTSSCWCWRPWRPPRRSASAPAGPTALLAFFPAVPSPRCCRSASPASACAKGRSCCSSTRSACPTEQAVALGLLLYLLNLGVSLLGAPAFAVGGARRSRHRRRMPTAALDPERHRGALDRRPTVERRRPRPRPRPAVVARGRLHRRSSTSCTRRCGTSSARRGGEVDPEPAFDHAKDIIQHPGSHRPLLRGRRCSAGTSTCRCTGCIRFWNIYYGIVPLRRHRRRPRLAVPPAPGALPPVAQHARLHHAARPGGVRLVLAHATPPARRPRTFGGCQIYAAGQDLPDEAGEPPCDRYGFVDTLADYGGWGRSTARSWRRSRTSTPPCRACTSAGRRGAPWCWRRWCAGAGSQALVVAVSVVHRCSASWSRPTTTGSTASAGSICLGAGYLIARAGTRWWSRATGFRPQKRRLGPPIRDGLAARPVRG